MKKLIVSFVVIAAMSAGVIHFQTVVFSQMQPFTISQILRAVSTPSKNKKALFKKIVNDVRSRGVDFPLTAENESELRNAGATNELIKAIRQNSPETSNSNSNAQVKTGATPIVGNEIAVIEMEQPAFGTIKIELYSNIAPKMVARFKELAKKGVYNGTTFHRINENVIQGGDPLSKDNDPTNDGLGGSDKPNVPAEFSDIPFDTGIVGAARGQDNDSANSQFFIMLKRQPNLDNRFTVFGKVIEGMNNVRTISGVNTKQGERPLENVVVKSVTIQPR